MLVMLGAVHVGAPVAGGDGDTGGACSFSSLFFVPTHPHPAPPSSLRGLGASLVALPASADGMLHINVLLQYSAHSALEKGGGSSKRETAFPA